MLQYIGTNVDFKCRQALCKTRERLEELKEDESGQGTTEYAILVGVIVVIAIVAVALFKDKLQELWDSIAEGINSL